MQQDVAQTATKRSTDPEVDRKHAAYKTLVQQGMSKTAAAKMLGYSTGSITALDKAVMDKGRKLSIVTDSNVRIAHRTIKAIAQGKTIGNIETVRASDALKASEVILDRAEPKAQDSTPAHISFTNINLSIAETPKPIDITPSQVIDITETACLTSRHGVVEQEAPGTDDPGQGEREPGGYAIPPPAPSSDSID